MPATGDQPLANNCGDMALRGNTPPAPGLRKRPLGKPPRAPGQKAHKACADITNNTRPLQLVNARSKVRAHPAGATASMPDTSEGNQGAVSTVTARYLPIQRLFVPPVKASSDGVPRKRRTTKHGPRPTPAEHWGRTAGAAAIAVAQEIFSPPAPAAAGGMDSAAAGSGHLKRPAAGEQTPAATTRQQRRRASPAAAPPAGHLVTQQAAAAQQQVGVGRSNMGTSNATAAAGGEVTSSTRVGVSSSEECLMDEEEGVAAAALMALGAPAAEGPQQQAGGEQSTQQQHQHQQQAGTRGQPQVNTEQEAAALNWLVSQGMLRQVEGGQLDALSGVLWRQWRTVLRYYSSGRGSEAMGLAFQLGGATATLLPRV